MKNRNFYIDLQLSKLPPEQQEILRAQVSNIDYSLFDALELRECENARGVFSPISAVSISDIAAREAEFRSAGLDVHISRGHYKTVLGLIGDTGKIDVPKTTSGGKCEIITDTGNIKISIDICRGEDKHYEYNVRYKDFCYAVAKTCTEVLKSHGIYGYHHSIYEDDMHLRYLLFIKSVALENFEARELTDMGEKNGESTSFEKELELLLFDM